MEQFPPLELEEFTYNYNEIYDYDQFLKVIGSLPKIKKISCKGDESINLDTNNYPNVCLEIKSLEEISDDELISEDNVDDDPISSLIRQVQNIKL